MEIFFLFKWSILFIHCWDVLYIKYCFLHQSVKTGSESQPYHPQLLSLMTFSSLHVAERTSAQPYVTSLTTMNSLSLSLDPWGGRGNEWTRLLPVNHMQRVEVGGEWLLGRMMSEVREGKDEGQWRRRSKGWSGRYWTCQSVRQGRECFYILVFNLKEKCLSNITVPSFHGHNSFTI